MSGVLSCLLSSVLLGAKNAIESGPRFYRTPLWCFIEDEDEGGLIRKYQYNFNLVHKLSVPRPPDLLIVWVRLISQNFPHIPSYIPYRAGKGGR